MLDRKGLTPAVQRFFNELKKQPEPENPFWTMNEEEFIKNRAVMCSGFSELAGKPSSEVEIKQSSIRLNSGSILNISIITPEGKEGLLPTLIYFPGGGFTLNLNAHQIPCSYMAKESGFKIIIVNCSLAPEHKFPKGLNDAYQATLYFYENAEKFSINRKFFAVGGDSSGGNFAALTTIKLTQERPDINLSFQLLISPNVDESLETYDKTPFKKYQNQDLMVTRKAVVYFRDLYLPKNVDPRSPYVSPLFADLKGLPPTILTCGEYDGVRGDTEAYYEKLIKEGNFVKKFLWNGQVHNSMLCRARLSDGTHPAVLIGQALKNALLKSSNNDSNEVSVCNFFN